MNDDDLLEVFKACNYGKETPQLFWCNVSTYKAMGGELPEWADDLPDNTVIAVTKDGITVVDEI